MRIAALIAIVVAGRAAGFDHSAWERVLRAHLNDKGEMDYAAIQARPAELGAYIRAIEATSPDSHPALFATRQARLSYWLNAYNALVTQAVVKAYPVGSVRDLDTEESFFDRKEHRLGGVVMSLLDVENLIRNRFRDPRIHFAIVCASISCPRLDREAFRGKTLDAHLDRLTRQFLAEPRNVKIDHRGRSVELSRLFQWYAADFFPTVSGFLARYGVRLPLGAAIHYRAYDWSVNDPGSRARELSSPSTAAR